MVADVIPSRFGRVFRQTLNAMDRLREVESRRTIAYEPEEVGPFELRALEPERRFRKSVFGKMCGKRVVPEIIRFREPEHDLGRVDRVKVGLQGQ
jgi:hypothetical protein